MSKAFRPPPPSLHTAQHDSLSGAKSKKKEIKKQINTQTFLKDKQKRKLEKARRKLEKQTSGQQSLLGKIKGIFTGVGQKISGRDRKTQLQYKIQNMTQKLQQHNNTIKLLRNRENNVNKQIENIKQIRNDKNTQKKVIKKITNNQ